MLALVILIPLFIGFSQVQQNRPDSSSKESEIKSKIVAIFDTIKIAVDAKLSQRKPVIKTKVINQKTLVKETIVYRDTCLSHVVQNYIFARVPDTIVKPEVPPAVKKLKWYQFRAKRKEKQLIHSSQ